MPVGTSLLTNYSQYNNKFDYVNLRGKKSDAPEHLKIGKIPIKVVGVEIF